MAHVLNKPMMKGTGVHGGDYWHKTRKLVLCFDGTGNKFHGDESDSNILKIFRLLDSSSSDQFQYYQPGIGTYVVSENISHTGLRAKCGAWYQMAKDSAIGSSFDQHVVGGYRFLMRYYTPGDEIYMFGFSRGAYVARFLAEMLDFVGLLAHGNEEMVLFAWNSFAQWQSRRSNSTGKGKEAKDEMYKFLKGFRETFSRPIRRIRFLGLFDTVNSVPRFEAAWMQRSKFPFTARTSAKVVRHAVSIDERRAKFRQDLIYQEPPDRKKKTRQNALQAFMDKSMEKTHLGNRLQEFQETYRPGRRTSLLPSDALKKDERGRRKSTVTGETAEDQPAPFRQRSRSRSRTTRGTGRSGPKSDDAASYFSAVGGDEQTEDEGYDSDENEQDVDEVWFAGGHADIGGGWDVEDEQRSASHIPLVWMVRQAMKAGLNFDVQQLEELGIIECAESFDPYDQQQKQKQRRQGESADDQGNIPEIQVNYATPVQSPTGCAYAEKDGNPLDQAAHSEMHRSQKEIFDDMLTKAHTARIHDSLAFGGGLPHLSVAMWRFMEWMPFRRLDLRPDGTWKPIRWPLPRGEVRDIPDNVRVHGSVIRRMEQDEKYRPGNLIVGGGGRGVRIAPKEHGKGEWVCVSGQGDLIEEVWVRKAKNESTDEDSQG